MPKGRVEKEKRMIKLMTEIYCHKNHKTKGLCEECQALLDYSFKRLSYCKFGDEKTFCGKCPIRCYKKDMREQVREVMKFSGKRIIFYHPVEVMKHIFS